MKCTEKNKMYDQNKSSIINGCTLVEMPSFCLTSRKAMSDLFKDEPSFFERYEKLRALPNAEQLKSEIFLAAKEKYATVLKNLRSWIKNPDNEYHELGTPCFALEWVVRQELLKAHCKRYHLRTCTRSNKRSMLGTGSEQLCDIIIFSDNFLADLAERLSNHAREKMLKELALSVELNPTFVEFHFPHLDELYPWVKQLFEERGLALTFESTVTSMSRSVYIYTVSCDQQPVAEKPPLQLTNRFGDSGLE